MKTRKLKPTRGGHNSEPVPMTREGKLKIEQELEYLTTVRRREIAEQLKEASSHGDLRENAGYEVATHDQTLLENRILQLKFDLKNSVMIETAPPADADAVELGHQVVIREQGSTREETYVIVGKTESDPVNGRISNESPMGRALLRKRVGEVVDVTTPGGAIAFLIVRIENAAL